MMTSKRIKIWMILGFLGLSLGGCSGPDQPVPVEGKVTLDGEAVVGATVTFIPANGAGHPAVGQTDQAGVFHLTTYKKNDGAIPGEYKVVVAKMNAIEEPPSIDSGDNDAVLKHYQSLKSQKRSFLLPKRYADVAITPLNFTVPSKENADLALVSDRKAQ